MDKAFEGEQVHVGLHGEGRVHAVGGAVVAGPGLLHPLGLVPELAAGHAPSEEDIAIRLGVTDVGNAEALGHLLAQGLPEMFVLR